MSDVAKLKIMYRTAKELGATECTSEREFIAKMQELARKYGRSRG